MAALKHIIVQRWNTIDESWRVAIVTFVVARLFYFVWSVVIFAIQPIAIQNFELSNEPILSIFQLENSKAYIYSREIQGQILTFQAANPATLIDQQTGSIWDISTGKARQGALEGTALPAGKTQPNEIFPYQGIQPYSGRWLAMWQRFDANWYVSIAERGYGTIPGDVHFPPLYPLLMRVVQPIIGNTFLAGLLISHLATLYLLKLLYDVYSAWGDRTAARRSVLFFVIYPTFFFCFSTYTESLFLVTVLLALHALSKRSWLWAGFWTFCAVLTRLQGVALLIPMLWTMWRDQPFLRKFTHWAGGIIAGSSGLLYLYLRSQQSSADTIPLAEPELHARIVTPWQAYWSAIQNLFSSHATFIDILNWSITTLLIVMIIVGWKRLPIEYNLFAVFSLLITIIRMVDTQPLNSMTRYSLTIFPIFFLLSQSAENPWIQRAIIYGSVLLSLYLSGQFFLWGWVG